MKNSHFTSILGCFQSYNFQILCKFSISLYVPVSMQVHVHMYVCVCSVLFVSVLPPLFICTALCAHCLPAFVVCSVSDPVMCVCVFSVYAWCCTACVCGLCVPVLTLCVCVWVPLTYEGHWNQSVATKLWPPSQKLLPSPPPCHMLLMLGWPSPHLLHSHLSTSTHLHTYPLPKLLPPPLLPVFLPYCFFWFFLVISLMSFFTLSFFTKG